MNGRLTYLYCHRLSERNGEGLEGVCRKDGKSTRSCSFRSARVQSAEQQPRSVDMGRALLQEGINQGVRVERWGLGDLGTWESRSTVRDIGLKMSCLCIASPSLISRDHR